MLKNYFSVITRSTLSIAGTAIATVGVLLFITLFAIQVTGFRGGPYIGIITYLLLPGIVVAGLILVPVGIWRQKKREAVAASHGEPAPHLPVIDFNSARTRKALAVFGAMALIGTVVLAVGTYKGVEYMESVEFCGTTCHTVMQPEYTAYQRSPHSRVACASCHIGPGADWFVKSKLSGSWQLIAVTFNLYPTPISTPVHNLRPARETCEQCHWPTKFAGDKLRVRTHFSEDEKNTELHNVLLVKVGGEHGRTSRGIHWHVDPGVAIRYLSDESRETIYDVEMTDKDGTKKLFKAKEEAPAGSTWRTMDCVDCHNRPTHIYRQPDKEIDAALDQGTIDKTLPFIKREGLRAVQVEYPSHEAARAGIAQDIAAFYAKTYPEVAAGQAAAVEQAGKALGDIYAWNVFPAMKVTWGTYPNHLGHKDSPGCFRCHDKKHVTADGEKIKKDCDTCHTILAEDEEDPPILRQMAGEEPAEPAPAAAPEAGAAATTSKASEPAGKPAG
ncbi:MAG TPA: NapC/NirT family cytochrome c [Steroidobacteraceae bacterium]